MRFVSSILLALFFAVLFACGSPPKTVSQSPGERAFRANCRVCHRLPNPKSHTDEEWPIIVWKYGSRANIPSAQIAEITKFLTSVN